MERQHLYPLDVGPTRDQLGNRVDVLHGVGETGDEDEADPNRLLGDGQAISKFDGRGELPSGDLLVDIGQSALHIQEDEVDVIQHVVVALNSEETGGVNAGVDAEFFGCPENTAGELRLEEGLTTGDGDSSTGCLEDLPIAVEPFNYRVDSLPLTIFNFEGVGIVAVLAA